MYMNSSNNNNEKKDNSLNSYSYSGFKSVIRDPNVQMSRASPVMLQSLFSTPDLEAASNSAPIQFHAQFTAVINVKQHQGRERRTVKGGKSSDKGCGA
ncbi:hypothetical protein ACLKA6_009913 [Drosophila palustris]